MKPGRAVLACVLLLLGPVLAGQERSPQTFRGGANVVLVDAYPKKDGKIVEGLTAADFEVREDGRPQVIDTVEFIRGSGGVPDSTRRDPSGLNEMYAAAADPHNQVIVAYLDTLHAGVDAGVLARGPLVRTIDRLVGPRDLFGVMTPNLRSTDLTLGRGTQAVDDALARHWAWGQAQRAGPDPNDSIETDLVRCFHKKVLATDGSVIDWLVDDGSVKRFLDEILIERRREDRTFTSLENLIRHLGAVRDTRSVLLTLTNGWVLARRWESLAAEPFKAPEDARFRRLLEPGGQPRPGDELVRLPPPTGRGGTTVAVEREIQGCHLELDRLSRLDHPQRFRELQQLATRNNVSIFPVAVGGLAATDGGAAERVFVSDTRGGATPLGRDAVRMSARVTNLREIAEVTGGTAVVNTNDLAAGFDSLVDELSGFYLISYSPTDARRDGRYRRIDVRVRPPGVVVRARAGYVANDVLAGTGPATARRAPDPAAAAVETALGALGRARPSSELTTTAAVDGLTLTAVAEFGAELRASGWSGGGDVEVEVSAADGTRVGRETGRIQPGTRAVELRVQLGLSTGPWRVTTRVSGARRLQDTVTASARPAILLGEPLVYRATPSPRSPLAPVADLLFSRTERLRVVWPVVDAPEELAARLLDREGRALGGPLPASRAVDGDRAVVVVDLVLGALSDGDYVVEMQSRRGTVSERRLQAFRVVR